MPPSPVELIANIRSGLDAPTPTLPTAQALRELNMAMEGENNTDQNRKALQQLLEHNLLQLDHHVIVQASHQETGNALRGLRNAIGMPLSRPEAALSQPEFVRPVARTNAESLNPGLRRPVLGGILAAGVGIVGASYLWNLLSKPGETIKKTAQTAVTGVLAAGAVVGGYFALRNVRWGEVGSTISGWGSTAAGWVPDVAAVSLLALPESMVPASWRQWALRHNGPEAVKKDEEAKKKTDQEGKEKAEKEKALEETTTQLANAINARPNGTLLTAPPWNLDQNGMRASFGPDALYIERAGARFRAAVTMEVSGVRHVLNLSQAEKVGNNIRFNDLPEAFTKAAPATAKTLRGGISVSMLTPTLADAVSAFQGGSREFEKNVSVLFIPIGTVRITLTPA